LDVSAANGGGSEICNFFQVEIHQEIRILIEKEVK